MVRFLDDCFPDAFLFLVSRTFCIKLGRSHWHVTSVAFVVRAFFDLLREKRDYRISLCVDGEERPSRFSTHFLTPKVGEEK